MQVMRVLFNEKQKKKHAYLCATYLPMEWHDRSDGDDDDASDSDSGFDSVFV